MWFLEKVAIICLAQFVMIPRTHTKPHTFLNNNQANGNNNKYAQKKFLMSVKEATDFKNSDKNSESILNTFNFHEIEYPVASTLPQQFYFQDLNDNQPPHIPFKPDASTIKRSSGIKPTRNGTFHHHQKLVKPTGESKAKNSKSLSALSVAFSSDSDFRNIGNFPEVEYPLSAKETWKPNYWSIPSDYKDLNALLAEDSHFNQKLTNIYPIKHLGTSSKSGKCHSFPIKSFSHTTKNKDRLKQIIEYKANNATKANKKQNNSSCRNDFILNNNNNIIKLKKNFATNDIETLPTDKIVKELHTAITPKYFTYFDIIPDCKDRFKTDFLNNNTFSTCNKNNTYLSIQNALISKIMEPGNQFTDNNILHLIEKSEILPENNNSDEKDGSSKNIQEMKYDLYDILDIKKTEAGSDLCDLDEDYTTDIYPEEKNIEWFSQPITTPPPCSASTVDLQWKNCKIITPCEYNVDELKDYYISV